MHYLIIERFRAGDPSPVYRRFRDRGRLAPDGLSYLESWVTDDLTRCYQLMECDDPALLEAWIAEWSDLVDFEIVPVISSEAAGERVLPPSASPAHVATEERLVACTWPDLGPRYDGALRAAVRFIFDRFEPQGIVAAGSIVRGSPDASSDLDIFVIHDAPYGQRLQRWFGDVPTEIFVNSPSSARAYFESEHPRGRPSAAHMIATGFVVLRSELLESLRTEAADWLARRSPFTGDGETSSRYAAATLLEDALDVAERDPATADALLGEVVPMMLRHLLRVRQGRVPGSKQLLAEVERSSPEVGRAARAFFAGGGLETRIRAAHAIADACIGVRGFFEWESELVPAAALRSGANRVSAPSGES